MLTGRNKISQGGKTDENSTDFLKFYRQSKSFANDISKFDYDFDLVSGRYVVDAKSIMGIFSLDLSKPIDLNIHTEEGADEVLEFLKAYIVP